ncbi:MAG: uridine diphosphate-N-acetylglucosamine-binding protein YvcK [Sporichthyaceae bacterium]|nr:uridine diphosphate-N-acetylglucosamine-binding protein YvcK [Sporichthyaceae bacterium]
MARPGPVPRGLRRRPRPPVRERAPATPAAGRRPGARRDPARAQPGSRPPRRCRPRGRHLDEQHPRAAREDRRRVPWRGRHNVARHDRVLRLQVRAPGGRRPRRRLPLPAQPALGRRAASQDRPRRGGPGVRPRPGRRRGLRHLVRRVGEPDGAGIRPRGQAVRHDRGRLHRRQAPQRRDRRAAGQPARRCRARHPRRPPRPGARVTAGQPVASGPRVAALGGGHGLAASLSALRRVTEAVTAVVTVADDGGSSGRLRRELGVLPPGDLRMALAALCGDDEWGQTWSRVVQHRFASEGELHGHAVGNLLIVALWELLDDPVRGLDWVGRLLGARGRVLPMSSVPLEMVAMVAGLDPDDSGRLVEVRGQESVATTEGRVVEVHVEPRDPPACAEAVAAVEAADWVVLGPGSWFTSVIPHLLVPQLRRAIVGTSARRLVNLNLAAQSGETTGFSQATHLEVLAAQAPELRLDVVLADASLERDPVGLRDLESAASGMGGAVVLADVAARDGSPRHDPVRLARAYAQVFARERIAGWR